MKNVEECQNAVCRFPMFIVYIIVTVLTVAANTYAAVVDFRRPQWVLGNIARWSRSDSWLFTLGASRLQAHLDFWLVLPWHRSALQPRLLGPVFCWRYCCGDSCREPDKRSGVA